MSRWIRQWAPALVWAAVIWTLSTERFSAAGTAQWIKPLLRWLIPGISAHALDLAHYYIRKTAHVVEYVLFTLLLYRALRGRQRGWRLKWALVASAAAACYAGLDEFHQSFVAGRHASPWDSLLDTAGALLAMALAYLWSRLNLSGAAS
jgi:VanZ family protein